jgi:signal recognition particle subunit SRP68
MHRVTAVLTALDRYVHLLLLSAERAYAHALSMKTSGTEDGTGLPAATRAHIAQRTHKAASYASELAELLSSDASTTKATETDILEAKAYAFTLDGAAQLEKHGAGNRSNNVEAQREKWASCLENYAAARVVYVALMKSTKDDVFKEFVAGTIDPAIRFAAYQSYIPRTVPAVTVSRRCFPSDEEDLQKSVEKLDATAFDDGKAVAGGAEGTADVPSSIDWRGRKAKISDAAIGQALASVAGETANLEKALQSDDTKDRSAAYDPVLIAAQDAADATRHAIDDHEKEKISEAEPRMQDLRVTNLAVNYDLISWRVGRNRVLIGSDDGLTLNSSSAKKAKTVRKAAKESTEKPEGNGRKLARLRERIVLFDAILQSLESVKEVPGAMRDTSFISELEGKKAYFQALKYVFPTFILSFPIVR